MLEESEKRELKSSKIHLSQKRKEMDDIHAELAVALARAQLASQLWLCNF